MGCPRQDNHCRGGKSIRCRIATGGRSYPLTGSDGDGYRMAKALGHTIVPPRPSLTCTVRLSRRVSPSARLSALSLFSV